MQIERKLAPFWKGLNDFSESWVEHQIVAAVRGMPIPAADEIPPELEYKLTPKSQGQRQTLERNLNSLTVPITSRSQSFNSDSSRPASPHGRSSQCPGSSSSNIFSRSRAKTLATLGSSKSSPSPEPSPKEYKLPHDPFVNGQPIEAYLYKQGTECPICFLYYPPYLNQTRCCDQPICSECFVQIKRPDPHPPEHEHPDPNAPPRPQTEEGAPSEGQLVSEPSACPFCVQPEFGVTYTPPPFRRGLTYSPTNGAQPIAPAFSATSSSTSLQPGTTGSLPTGTRRRATSLSADAPGVIATDKIRPDWAQKLAAARAHAARRAAAATALHTAAYLMNNNQGSSSEQRGIGSVSRRALLRRGTGSDSASSRTSSPHVATLAHLAERRAVADPSNDSGESGNLAPPRASSRRNRIDELEEMMMMEAIRLSLAAEDERRKKEEKEAKKAAKRREKESKKAEKQAKVPDSRRNSTSDAIMALDASSSQGGAQLAPSAPVKDTSNDKGKGVDRSSPPPALPQSLIGEGSSGAVPKIDVKMPDNGHRLTPLTTSSSADFGRKVHMRQFSSASSSNSSLVESAIGEPIGSSAPHNGATPGIEPSYNFQSLASVVDDEVKSQESTQHVEDSEQGSSQQQGEANGEKKREDKADNSSQSSEEQALETKEAKTESSELISEPSPMGTAS